MGTFNQQSRHFGCYLLPDLVFLPSFSLGPISHLLFYFIFFKPHYIISRLRYLMCMRQSQCM